VHRVPATQGILLMLYRLPPDLRSNSWLASRMLVWASVSARQASLQSSSLQYLVSRYSLVHTELGCTEVASAVKKFAARSEMGSVSLSIRALKRIKRTHFLLLFASNFSFRFNDKVIFASKREEKLHFFALK